MLRHCVISWLASFDDDVMVVNDVRQKLPAIPPTQGNTTPSFDNDKRGMNSLLSFVRSRQSLVAADRVIF
jgi:hypothetical protein